MQTQEKLIITRRAAGDATSSFLKPPLPRLAAPQSAGNQADCVCLGEQTAASQTTKHSREGREMNVELLPGRNGYAGPEPNQKR